MRLKQKPKPGTVVGYGYVGLWHDGRLGWFMPRHLTTSKRDKAAKRYTQRGISESWNDREPGFLCRITLQPQTDSRGRFIVRRQRKLE